MAKYSGFFFPYRSGEVFRTNGIEASSLEEALTKFLVLKGQGHLLEEGKVIFEYVNGEAGLGCAYDGDAWEVYPRSRLTKYALEDIYSSV